MGPRFGASNMVNSHSSVFELSDQDKLAPEEEEGDKCPSLKIGHKFSPENSRSPELTNPNIGITENPHEAKEFDFFAGTNPHHPALASLCQNESRSVNRQNVNPY
jgi:hypothetical protein